MSFQTPNRRIWLMVPMVHMVHMVLMGLMGLMGLIGLMILTQSTPPAIIMSLQTVKSTKKMKKTRQKCTKKRNNNKQRRRKKKMKQFLRKWRKKMTKSLNIWEGLRIEGIFYSKKLKCLKSKDKRCKSPQDQLQMIMTTTVHENLKRINKKLTMATHNRRTQITQTRVQKPNHNHHQSIRAYKMRFINKIL